MDLKQREMAKATNTQPEALSLSKRAHQSVLNFQKGWPQFKPALVNELTFWKLASQGIIMDVTPK